MSLITCEINLLLTWTAAYVISVASGATTFETTKIKFYVLVVILSTKDNAKLSQQLKSSFNRTIDWDKYYSKLKIKK